MGAASRDGMDPANIMDLNEIRERFTEKYESWQKDFKEKNSQKNTAYISMSLL